MVTAPATASGAENTLITFTVTAADPDGDAITNLSRRLPLPSGATFTANASNTSGTFSWTPSFTQAGSYNVTFTASNALSGSATTAITVTNVDRAPVVTAPATASGAENTLITFTVTAADPDGDAITSLTASASCGCDVHGQRGQYVGHVQLDAELHAGGQLQRDVHGVERPVRLGDDGDHGHQRRPRAPVVTAPATASFAANTLITFTVSAADPDGDAITSLTAAPPSGRRDVHGERGEHVGNLQLDAGLRAGGAATA